MQLIIKRHFSRDVLVFNISREYSNHFDQWKKLPHYILRDEEGYIAS